MRDIDTDTDSGAQRTDNIPVDSTVSTMKVRDATVVYDIENDERWIQSDTAIDLAEVA